MTNKQITADATLRDADALPEPATSNEPGIGLLRLEDGSFEARVDLVLASVASTVADVRRTGTLLAETELAHSRYAQAFPAIVRCLEPGHEHVIVHSQTPDPSRVLSTLCV